jgi:hypothetical protein
MTDLQLFLAVGLPAIAVLASMIVSLVSGKICVDSGRS